MEMGRNRRPRQSSTPTHDSSPPSKVPVATPHRPKSSKADAPHRPRDPSPRRPYSRTEENLKGVQGVRAGSVTLLADRYEKDGWTQSCRLQRGDKGEQDCCGVATLNDESSQRDCRRV
jgi:hypothetical protein